MMSARIFKFFFFALCTYNNLKKSLVEPGFSSFFLAPYTLKNHQYGKKMKKILLALYFLQSTPLSKNPKPNLSVDVLSGLNLERRRRRREIGVQCQIIFPLLVLLHFGVVISISLSLGDTLTYETGSTVLNFASILK